MISPMQLRDRHHVANFGIFVSLGPKEGLAIGHADGLLCSLLETLKISEVGLRVDESTTCFKRQRKRI